MKNQITKVAALAVLIAACGDAAGEALIDAGEMMSPDADAQEPEVNEAAECDMSETTVNEAGVRTTGYWAEFEVEPGKTEVTVCYRGNPDATVAPFTQDTCTRGIASWFAGTTTGYVSCSYATVAPDGERRDYRNTTSITVHR